mgnify:CR=1 FL=1
MEYNKSSNPTLSALNKVSHASGSNHMTESGTFNKVIILTLIVVLFGYFGWNTANPALIFPLLITTLIVGLAIVIALAFKPLWAPVLAPIYAVVEGYFLGVISVFFNLLYPGIVMQAIMLTLLVAFIMNYLYRARIIKVTEKFRSVIMIATFSIFGIYMISILVDIFAGSSIPLIHEGGLIGIGFSLVVVTIASLNLLLDYDFIEKSSKNNLPKAMEWYGAFALIVTLVWLYLEILKLLAKLRSND